MEQATISRPRSRKRLVRRIVALIGLTAFLAIGLTATDSPEAIASTPACYPSHYHIPTSTYHFANNYGHNSSGYYQAWFYSGPQGNGYLTTTYCFYY